MVKFKFNAEKTETIETSIEGSNILEATLEFQKRNPGFKIEAIDDKELVGICEISGEPIFDGDSYSYNEDGIYVLNKNV